MNKNECFRIGPIQPNILYSFDLFTLHLRPFDLPLIPKHGEEHVTHQH
jgi:hypothetical protein